MFNRNFDRRSANIRRILAATGPHQRWFTPRVETLEDRLALSTFTVINTGDSGPGSLRQAILDANAAADPPTIEFHIPTTDANFVDADSALPGGDAAADVFVIEPATPLPALTRGSIVVDGQSQQAFGGDTNAFGPEIVLNGPDSFNADGLRLESQVNHIRGLTIQGFAGAAIRVSGSRNLISGNYLGTDATGTLVNRNYVGIQVIDSAEVVIGGTLPGEGNLISANGTNVSLEGSNTSGTLIQGNRIGTDRSGSSSLTNGWPTGTNDDGVVVSGGAHDAVIGGTQPGAENLISGHWGQGIWIIGGPGGNRVEGNRLGTNAAGTAAVPNLRGVLISSSPSNSISSNLISGNFGGIGIGGPAASGNVIQGNSIGLDVSGTASLMNPLYGIEIQNAPETIIGGVNVADRNVISGGANYGVKIVGPGSHDTLVQGNHIGTDITGTAALGNQTGIWIVDHADGNFVGGSAPGAGNLISGNVTGVLIDEGSQTNRIQGNSIGTDLTGTTALTAGTGIAVAHGAAGNFIGTDGDGFNDAHEGNLISGNSFDGVFLWAGAERNVVAGNLLGTDPTGQNSVPNGHGVTIRLASNNRIGTNADGVSDDLERNVLSGNNGAGVVILAEPNRTEGADENVIAGNYIGTTLSGTQPLGNGSHGILLAYSHLGDLIAPPTGNVIGGTSPAARNVIAANGGNGIHASMAEETVIQGNYSGVAVDGITPLGNFGSGVALIDSTNSLVGGAVLGVGNVISANLGSGVQVFGGAGHTIQGNSIGLDTSGNYALGNSGDGVRIDSSSGNTIGSALAGGRNIISGNGSDGVELHGIAASGNLVLGNYIGTDVTGSQDLGNFANGVFFEFAPGNRVGGTEPGAGNVISGNDFCGVTILGVFSNGNEVLGNYIGTDASGTADLGNSSNGVFINSAPGNTIGGTAIGAGNVIAGNHGDGVGIFIDGATGNRVQGNSIHSNGRLGIDLGGDGVTANDGADADSGVNNLQNFPVLGDVQAGATTHVTGTLNSTPNATFNLDFYASAAGDPSGHGEGQRWLGSFAINTDGLGNAALDAVLAAATASGEFITATATDAAGNTSEFSRGLEIENQSVLIDIKPGSSMNPVNLQENGVIPVAILTTLDFDAQWVNASTVVFAGATAVHSALEDVDGDGDLDMILHFRVQDTNLPALYEQLLLGDLDGDGVLDSNHQQLSATLTGQTVDEVFFAGTEDLDLFLAGKNLRTFLDELAALGSF